MKLIRRYREYNTGSFDHFLAMAAANIEDGWIMAGAVAGEDYTKKDILIEASKIAATEIAQNRDEENGQIQLGLTAEYPNGE